MSPSCADAISDLIRQQHVAVGARLPSERELAAQLGFSRGSIREALVSLAAQGRIEIRERSGCYLRPTRADAWRQLRETASVADVAAALRAVAPHIASEAAARCGPEQSHRLELSTTRLGRHLVDRDAPALVGEFLAFLRLLAKSARNPFVELMIAEASTATRLAEAAGELEKSRTEAFFALHVGLLHALQARDGRRAATLASHCLGAFEALLDPSTRAIRETSA